MAPWLVPAIKAVLPYLSSIISAAIPVFTARKSEEEAAAQASLLRQQIDELQTAASQNAVHIKELAEQLQKTVAGLEQGAEMAEARFRRMALLCGAALILSFIALCLSLVVLLRL
jgi:uncharacterized protein YlxW (UPF0749 family)